MKMPSAGRVTNLRRAHPSLPVAQPQHCSSIFVGQMPLWEVFVGPMSGYHTRLVFAAPFLWAAQKTLPIVAIFWIVRPRLAEEGTNSLFMLFGKKKPQPLRGLRFQHPPRNGEAAEGASFLGCPHGRC